MLLGRLGEVLLYVELADRLAEHAAHESSGTLPTGTVLLCTRENAAELELCSAELVVELAGCAAYGVSLSVCLEVVKRLLCENLLHLADRLRLAYVDV